MTFLPRARDLRVETACLAAAALTGCAATGTRPHDMSVAHHLAAAGAERERAEAHAAEYDPSAVERVDCGNLAVLLVAAGPCWSELVNPTEGHRVEAERHRVAAAAHRAAVAALREVEASACAGVSDADRDTSPFSHREDILSISELVDRSALAADASGIVGVTIVFGAVPGLTVERLDRIVRCHVARNSVLGHDVPEMPYCLLVPNGVSTSVRAVDGGLAVDVRGESEAAVADIVRRARGLVP